MQLKEVIPVVGFIEDKEVIKKILKHLGIWLVKKRPLTQGQCSRSAYPLRLLRFLDPIL